MEEFTVADWQSDLLEYFADDIGMHAPREEGEFTAKEFVELLEKDKELVISTKTAHSWMDKAVKEGRAAKRLWTGERSAETILYRWVGNGDNSNV